ncbi:unnamed protein product [Brassicogethes aeneus]|uniref:Reticulocalbin-3 n=1 Tax=Brassicogethes aeneus TaxID=1431903 RepID=A0A9P0B6P3_BRAAE|nr:unnamed protein product [Brassicogethes aeneus]
MKNEIRTSLIFVAIYLFQGASAGVMHSHTNEINKEREEDGAYSPKDHGHFDDSGEHHSEFDHEAILGSHREAEEYDHLPPDESKARLRILLGQMDLTKDETIDRRELKAWILRSFRKLSEEEASDRLEDADENGDSIISWQEYLSDTYGIDKSEEAIQFDGDNDHLIEDDKALWKAADADGDGSLSKNEWLSFSHPEEHPAMLPVILKQTLRDKDKDGDEAVSFQEFVGERAQEHDKEWLVLEKEKFDRELDKNADGRLTGNEILSWVVPSNDEIADEEVDHLFVSSDDDHDDLLSFEEILEHYEVFVGSEATDYGDHLHNIHNFKDEL